MAIIDLASFASPAADREVRANRIAEIHDFFRQFFARAFDPYRPELHYMRGPGPACRAKQRAVSPAVQAMVREIRAAKSRRPTASI